MLFNSPLYGVFLLSCFVLFWAMRRRRLARGVFLVCASYVFYFYGTWDAAREQPVPTSPWVWALLCLGIIFVGSTVDFLIGRALGNTEDRRKRKALLLVSMGYYLGVLALFKYYNFAADSFADAARAVGFQVEPTHLRLVLPFGISFFTFETMSYTIDVYRRELPPAKRYVDYLLFVCFFPHLVAGPIVRPHQMLPQLEREPLYSPTVQAEGLFLIATGLLKKVLIGDFLAANLVRRVFENPERFTTIETVVAVYAYAVQIYADFSGYSDVAIGSAKLFGYELPINFDAPYTAKNLQDFWRRWHISLSTWLRDYLYVPLGGSHGSSLATYRNLTITMLLGGLWHGASWTFVIWGALHGAALAATRMWQRLRGDVAPSIAGRVVSVFATFHFVCFAWIFFRAPSFEHARLVLRNLVVYTPGAANVSARIVAILAIAMALHFVPSRWDGWVRGQFALRSSLVQGSILAILAILLRWAHVAESQPFIYGQF